jgi:5-methylcytosine-specific restriction endonuclease McrA
MTTDERVFKTSIKAREAATRYRYNHPETAKLRVAAWREKNKEHIKKYNHEYTLRSEVKKEIHAYNLDETTKERKRLCASKPSSKRKLMIRQKRFLSTEYGKATRAYWTARRRKYLEASSNHITAKEWAEIKRTSPLCPMCGKFVECENLSLDHIIPLSRGGENTKENVQALCLRCNILKSDKLPLGVGLNV